MPNLESAPKCYLKSHVIFSLTTKSIFDDLCNYVFFVQCVS